MSAQQRFILAVVLMLGVLVGGNLLFPPQPGPDQETTGEQAAGAEDGAPGGAPGGDALPAGPDQAAGDTPAGGSAAPEADAPSAATDSPAVQDTTQPAVGTDPELPELAPSDPVPQVAGGGTDQRVVVEGPLYRFAFSTLGARLVSAEMLLFPSFTRDGPVDLIGEGFPGVLGTRIVVDGDTIDLRESGFTATPASGLELTEGGDPQTLTLRYEYPNQPFAFEIAYTFDPGSYVVGVSGRTEGLSRGLLVTDLGRGPALNEADETLERSQLGYAINHLQTGIGTTRLASIEERRVEEGPLLWAATKSTYFAMGVLPRAQEGDPAYLGGVLASPLPDSEDRSEVAVTQSLDAGGTFAYRLYVGPQDFARMSALGNGFEEVNPVGWSFFRPVLRPIIALITWILVFFHTSLSIGYGWVLILVGVLMRLVLFPLYHKSMKAQLKNMAVQPLLKEIQTKYKDQPEKMQKELVKLYKDHGFNPLAGCWPMLLPWPVLIALFYTFRSTIELRGVPFWWLPDLSVADPYFILPVLLGASMFLMQWISMRSLDEVNPQMKIMMWGMPIFMLVIFANFPSGLNLYYLTANLATLPQTWWIARERQKVRAEGPPKPATT